MSALLCPGAICVLLSFASVARANPELQAELFWRGSCEDAADLIQQVRTRGAELELLDQPAPAEVDATQVVRVEVRVEDPAPFALVAQIQLQSRGGQEQRRVQAGTCAALRSAIAWVLVVLAQQRASEPEAAADTRNDSSSATSPGPVMEPSPPRTDATGARAAQPSSPVLEAPSPDRRNLLRAEPRRSWALGISFTAAFGLLPAPAYGPMLFGRYRPRPAWLPTLQLSVQRLATSGFESQGTAISVTRDAARLGVWVPLVGNALDLGLAAEVGRLVAAGSGATLERGSSDATLWFAFAMPLRLSIPVLGQLLRAELQAELDYSPVPYTFRYGSGDTLTSTAAFEGRGQVGLVSHF